MKKLLLYIIATLLLLPSCSRETRLIPRSKMAHIYADMYMTDQWIIEHRGKLNRLVDTTFVYAPILENYGYEREDYMHSLEVYLNDPDRYSRILRQTEDILKKRLVKLKKEKKKLDEIKAAKRKRDSILAFWSISMDSIKSAYLFDTLIVDTLSIDSLVVDSLAIDSLIVDSLRLDSLAVDSLRTSSVRDVHDESLDTKSSKLGSSHVSKLPQDTLIVKGGKKLDASAGEILEVDVKEGIPIESTVVVKKR